MQALILDILEELRSACAPDERTLAKIIHKHDRNIQDDRKHHAKKKLLPYYLHVKKHRPELWASWQIDEQLESKLIKLLQVKPRRTASGVATITVITKPWQCASNCIYCPSDLRMPKSYLSDEPACQRAERNYFDPYLQVVSRLRALTHMGHATDKIELIVLGGTFSDYPRAYRLWFICELFRALNDGTAEAEERCKQIRKRYKRAGIGNDEQALREGVELHQERIRDGQLSYNQAMHELYQNSASWQEISAMQVASEDELVREHVINEAAQHRSVGLVIETRPDTISAQNLTLLRRLGCTKVQLGIQSVNAHILHINERHISTTKIAEAFALLRLFGFKIHTHFMLNLLGADPEADRQDYRCFVEDSAYLPDEIKLYPCALVAGTKLGEHYVDGSWQPYSERELIDLLVEDVLMTPAYMRISRMIRDISAKDIVAGNKKTNLRQMVEQRLAELAMQPAEEERPVEEVLSARATRPVEERQGAPLKVQEIRYREISTSELNVEDLKLDDVCYLSSVSEEHFLQWLTPEAKIAGFLRLSLPWVSHAAKDLPISEEELDKLPVKPDEAMIREVHIYGKVARIGQEGAQAQTNAQHLGLGRRLIEEACAIAKAEGFVKMNVISAVGTRAYYRELGFCDNGLYQQKCLV